MDSNEYLITSSQSSQQCSACLWDYNTLNAQKFYRNGGTVSSKCLEFLGQDYLLTSEAGKPLLHVWPLNNQNVAKNIRLILPEPANCLAVCPHNIYLAVGINCKIYLWHLSSGKLITLQQKNYQPVTCIKFSSDGDFLLVAGQDGILIAYNLSDLTATSNNFLSQFDIGQVEPVYVKNDHSMPIRDIHVGHFGRKSRFATVSSDQTCRIYSLLTGRSLLTLVFDDLLTSVVFDSPCWQLFVGTEKGSIRQFNLKNPPKTISHHVDEKSELTFIGHKKRIVCLALNNSNNVLVSGSEDHFVITWELKSRQILKKIEHKAPITNVKFVLAYKNFSVENFKPKIILKSLERSRDTNTDFVISQIQTEDIELSDEETSLSNEKIRSDLMRDNQKLRIVNRQLYNAAIMISKKNSSSNIED
ncbi:unnamed protein product [Phaedon cochleariae]|uniref:Uncharacterized protein n=1 Tax=Phaedon cochleariae TaxID=80249 RepID=A0A9P0GVY1_PHACE|nr:unnamed protein product [Phaedon cochleariae]